jgi:hypothetical protein
VRRRQEWCQRWLERQHVRNPQLTPEWRQLLDDSVALLAENERLREALAFVVNNGRIWDDRDRPLTVDEILDDIDAGEA